MRDDSERGEEKAGSSTDVAPTVCWTLVVVWVDKGSLSSKQGIRELFAKVTLPIQLAVGSGELLYRERQMPNDLLEHCTKPFADARVRTSNRTWLKSGASRNEAAQNWKLRSASH